MSFTKPSSSQTVFSSRTVPSRVTRTRVLLGPPERRQQAGKPRSSRFPLHLPGEGIVVGVLVVDFQELVVQAVAFVVHALEGIEEAPFALWPPLDPPLRGLERSRRHVTAPGPSMEWWYPPGSRAAGR